MAQNSASIEELRSNAERSRGELTQAVDQLRTKVSHVVSDARDTASSDNVKAQLSSYVQSSMRRLLDQARENPLQALAIGAGVAYPLAGVARAIPVPLLLIGSGLFLFGAKNQQRAAQKIGEMGASLSASASDAFEAGRRTVHDLGDAASDRLSSVGNSLSAVGAAATRSASAAASNASAKVNESHDGVAQAKQALDSVQSNAARMVSTAVAEAGHALDVASTAGVETARRARDSSIEYSRNAGAYLERTTRENPLLVGGLALAAGMALASLMPRTQLEGTVLGPANRLLKDKARDMATQGLELAQDATDAALAEAKLRAGEEGFDPDHLRDVAEDMGSRVGKVFENAATTAFASVEHLNDQNEQKDARSSS